MSFFKLEINKFLFISDNLLMAKKKGKALALELVGDLFDKDKNKSKKSRSKFVAEKSKHELTAVIAPSDLPSIDDGMTKRLTHTEIHNTASYSQSKSHKDVGLSLESVLDQSENLKKAQDKIVQLENVIEDLRKDNEQLMSVTEAFKNNDEVLQNKISSLKSDLHDSKDQFKDEKKIIVESKKLIEKQLRDAKIEIEQLNNRLNTNLKKIRVRERELENRLEIVKLENVTLQRSKDERLLELKRQIDNFNIEIDSYKQKGEVLDLELEKNKNMLRKTVKALRLALTMLEMDEQEFEPASGDES